MWFGIKLFNLEIDLYLPHDECQYGQNEESQYNSSSNDHLLTRQYYELNSNFRLLTEKVKDLYYSSLFEGGSKTSCSS